MVVRFSFQLQRQIFQIVLFLNYRRQTKRYGRNILHRGNRPTQCLLLLRLGT
jgi:hypothetical protein